MGYFDSCSKKISVDTGPQNATIRNHSLPEASKEEVMRNIIMTKETEVIETLKYKYENIEVQTRKKMQQRNRLGTPLKLVFLWSVTSFIVFYTIYVIILHYENASIQFTENFTTKNRKFSDKKFRHFSYFCSKYRLWILVRTASPRRF